jgi:hypothetical protein
MKRSDEKFQTEWSDRISQQPSAPTQQNVPKESGAQRQARLMKEAEDAIKQGAPRDAVMKRMNEEMKKGQ